MDSLRTRLSALRFPVPTDSEGAVLVSIAAAEHHNGLVDAILASLPAASEVTRAAVVQMAGIKTEQEMAQLANSDPASWVAESQRQKAIATYLSQLDQQINGEKQAAQQENSQRQQQQKQQAYQKAWTELSQDGIDKPKLADIYAKTTKLYGFTSEELSEVYDARMVRVLKDAAAFRDLQSQKKAVTQKVNEAPKLQSRKPTPAQERRQQDLNNRFRSGKAKLNDLAAYLS